jgi:hypothetical protein
MPFFCYMWEYLVRPDRLDDFMAAYGPDGDWVQLFRRDESYLRTDLFRNRDDPRRFVTADHWVSWEDCRSFRERFRDEFDALDERCEALTIRETHLGDFERVG